MLTYRKKCIYIIIMVKDISFNGPEFYGAPKHVITCCAYIGWITLDIVLASHISSPSAFHTHAMKMRGYRDEAYCDS